MLALTLRSVIITIALVACGVAVTVDLTTTMTRTVVLARRRTTLAESTRRSYLRKLDRSLNAAFALAGETGRMNPPPGPHYRHRFSAAIISHAVWLYHVFCLSLRDVELLLAERGIALGMVVSPLPWFRPGVGRQTPSLGRIVCGV